jgi:cytochrome c553
LHPFVCALRASVLAAGLLGAGVVHPQPGSAEAGARKALTCQTCHGPDGLALLPDAPNLAGQNPVYLGKALKDFRSGARKHEVMSVVAKTLTDEDIRDLAAYYGAIEVIVKKPR